MTKHSPGLGKCGLATSTYVSLQVLAQLRCRNVRDRRLALDYRLAILGSAQQGQIAAEKLRNDICRAD